MAKIAVVSSLPLSDFLKHLELGGHQVLLSKNHFDLQQADIFHFVFDCSLQAKPSMDELRALGLAVAKRKKIAVTLRGPRVGIVFWPFLKAANMVTVEHKNHWLLLPAWVRGQSLLEILTLPLSLSPEVQSDLIASFKPYFVERRGRDFLVIHQDTKKSISIPHSISDEQQQLLVEHSSGYYQHGSKAGLRPQFLSWDLLINHLNRMYRSLTV